MLNLLQGLVRLSLALAEYMERRELMDAGKNKVLVEQLKQLSQRHHLHHHSFLRQGMNLHLQYWQKAKAQ